MIAGLAGIGGCAVPTPELDFVDSVLGYIDCQTQAIGSGGFNALAQPGSTLSLVLTAFLTLFVAFFGYRMLFGQTPGARDGVLALVKVGIVLALTASWPAYQTLVYDVVVNGPAELAAEIGRPAALPGSEGGLVARLAAVDVNLTSLDTLGTVAPVTQAQTTQVTGGGTGAGGTGTTPVQVQIINQTANQPDAPFLAGGHVLYLAGAVGSLAAVRLVAGLLLALGPFFIAFLLFDATRGLFEGWVRVLGGVALGALGIAIVLGVELALIEPWLADLVARRLASTAVPGVAMQLLVTFLIFAFALLAVLLGAAWVALGFRLPPVWRAAAERAVGGLRGEGSRGSAAPIVAGHVPAEGRSRAAFVVDAVAATQRREAGPPVAVPAFGTAGGTAAAAIGAAGGAPSRRVEAGNRLRDPAPATFVPIGQNFRHHQRVSRSAGRRDGQNRTGK